MRANTDRMLSMIDSAVAGAAPFLPVRLIVFPEFAHAAPVFETAKELEEKLAVEIPNEHTERLHQKAIDGLIEPPQTHSRIDDSSSAASSCRSFSGG